MQTTGRLSFHPAILQILVSSVVELELVFEASILKLVSCLIPIC